MIGVLLAWDAGRLGTPPLGNDYISPPLSSAHPTNSSALPASTHKGAAIKEIEASR